MKSLLLALINLPGIRTVVHWPPVRAVLRPMWRAAKGFAHRRRMKRAVRALARFSPPYKLHAGCGTVYLDGWLNLDLDPDAPRVDLRWDVSQCLPVPDGTCELIFTEHMLEHLSVEQGQQFLRECRRALRPGGVVRIAMPSLDDLIDKSATGRWREQDWLHEPAWKHIATRAEMLNVMFRWWGHQWLYDREELHRRLRQAGFTEFRDVERGESEIESLRGRETRANSLLICEAVKT